MKQPSLGLLLVALTGCGASMTFTGVGDPAKPLPATCEIDVLTAPPSGAYEELGTIDVQYKSQTGWITKADEFQRKVRPLVCQAGGDAVIAHTNDYGVYLKGTVLNTKSAPAVDSQPAPAPAEPEAEAGGEAGANAKQP
ncbi:MAG TPA: hypothetical protein VFZ61_13430 [Polyangiales bacterium]